MPLRCPICTKPTAPAFRPFCSQGCRDRDLLRWLDDGYRLPGPPVDEMTGGFPAQDGPDAQDRLDRREDRD